MRSAGFTLGDLAEFERFITEHEEIHTLDEFNRGFRDGICIRHDVDHDAEQALRFAEWEHERGIRSSYYLLPTAGYYQSEAEKAAGRLEEMGHEVGVHNDAYNFADCDPDRAIEVLTAWVEEMRSWGIKVTGCADHGGKVSNVWLWRTHGRKPSEAGLQYEAYMLHQQHTHYISDNRGAWSEPLTRNDRPTHVLVHPIHWPMRVTA